MEVVLVLKWANGSKTKSQHGWRLENPPVTEATGTVTGGSEREAWTR